MTPLVANGAHFSGAFQLVLGSGTNSRPSLRPSSVRCGATRTALYGRRHRSADSARYLCLNGPDQRAPNRARPAMLARPLGLSPEIGAHLNCRQMGAAVIHAPSVAGTARAGSPLEPDARLRGRPGLGRQLADRLRAERASNDPSPLVKSEGAALGCDETSATPPEDSADASADQPVQESSR